MPTQYAPLSPSVSLRSVGLLSEARAQCDPQWAPNFGLASLSRPVRAITTYNSGTGAALYVATVIPGTAALTRWDGTSFQEIGTLLTNSSEFPPTVNAFETFDLGSGPELIVAGNFYLAGGFAARGIAHWNGTTWGAFGSGLAIPTASYFGYVADACVFDDGGGAKLYATEVLTDGFDSSVRVWSQGAWQTVGVCMTGWLGSMVVFDDGAGPELYVGGTFNDLGGVSTRSIARWNGVAWSSVGGGVGGSGSISDLVVHDDGTGPALYVTGSFTQIGGVNAQGVARFKNGAWSAVGTGFTQTPVVLSAFDDGSGTKLYAVGAFSAFGGPVTESIVRWDGFSWTVLDAGVVGTAVGATTFNDGTGPALFVGGTFTAAGNVASQHLAKWRASGWTRLSDGQGADNYVRAITTHDDGNGPKVYVGGQFKQIGNAVGNGVARRDGNQWTALGSGFSGSSTSPNGPTAIFALASYDHGTGSALYAGGAFTSAGGVPARGIARWNGVSWAPLTGGGIDGAGSIYALHAFDDGSGPALYAGGYFTSIGGVVTKGIARWNGSAWSALGSGAQTFGSFQGVFSLASGDDGGGPALYAGGNFAGTMGEVAGTNNLARWRNGAWTPVATPGAFGADSSVWALFFQNDAQGPRLWIGGAFQSISGVSAHGIATWNGTTIAPVGPGFPYPGVGVNNVNAIAEFDAGAGYGRDVYVVGSLAPYSGTVYNGIARWDGTAWRAVSGGIAADSYNLQALHAAGESLWVAGGFPSSLAGARCITRLDRSCPDSVAFCSGDGAPTACPCGVGGASGRGCPNSSFASGTKLVCDGNASVGADTLQLHASDMTGPGLFFQASGLAANPIPFGDGLLCASAAIQRLGVVFPAAGAASFPGGAAPISLTAAPILSGDTKHYQCWYRDTVGHCTAATFNLSNGVSVVWLP
jgi:hypothetical protein